MADAKRVNIKGQVINLKDETARNGLTGKIDKTSIGVADGVAELDSNGVVPAGQLSSNIVYEIISSTEPSDQEDGDYWVKKVN